MSRLAMLVAFAGLMLSSVEPEAQREPLDRDPEPEPEPPRHTTPGIVVVQGRDEFGRQPAPVFRPRGWHPDTTYIPKQRSRAEDLDAIAAAQAKRDRKNRKRLQEQR